MVKTKRLRAKLPVSLLSYTSAFTMLMVNLNAFAETAPGTTNTTGVAVPVTKAASSGTMPLMIGLIAIIVIGAVVFMLTKKKDSTKIALPDSGKANPSLSPSSPRANISPPTPKNSITAPQPLARSPVATPTAAAPVAPRVETPVSTPPVSPPVLSSSVQTPKASPSPVSTPAATPSFSNSSSDAKPLFDSNKLESDLDNIFNDPKASASKPVEEPQKKAPLFDSNQLDSDLDSLFVEVNKKPEPKKEEKKGLFDSNQLDSDLDSLFSDNSQPASQPANNSDDLSSLFGSSSEPAKTEASSSNSTFDLDSLDFMDAKKEEPKSEGFALPGLDLSSLTGGNSEPAKTETASSTFDLDSLNFLSSDTKKEESKSDSFALPSFDLSSLTGGNDNSSSDQGLKTNPKANLSLDSKEIDLSTTTMGLNISDYLSSINSEKKEAASSFNLSDTIPPQSLNLSDLKMNSPVSDSLISETSEEKKKADGGVISIGKMLVDQNALEEIIKKAEKGGKAGLTTTQVITAVKGRSLDTLLVDIDNIDGIMGSIIVGKDGLVIANTMPTEVDKDLVGALTSSLFSNIDGQVKKLKKGNLKRLTVETVTGTYILTEIEMGTLVVFTNEDKKVNLTNVFKAITTVTGKR